ncbi:MAG TPA: class I SAM-dependent methyltransferase [Candidatus Dormibacteraeota bacterium]|nr:class I SAM-dependent methyltransferase [Candidatus Dormibacteraeota bacterium]
MTSVTAADEQSFWAAWQDSWDRQQRRFLPDREERFAVLAALVGAVVGDSPPRVLDLACGCGSITSRILSRFPLAQVVGADIDPVLLRIAAGVFAGDERVTLTEIDLRTPQWSASLPREPFDAVLSATALHWLSPELLAGVYRSVAALLRPGGVFADADQVPLLATPDLDRAAASLSPASDGVGEGWEEWWERVAQTPQFSSLLEERNRRFGGSLHPAEFTPAAEWHLEQLGAAGFSEAGVVWRRGQAAVVAALR